MIKDILIRLGVITNGLDTELEKAGEEIDDLGKKADNTTKKTKGFTDTLENIPGPAGNAAKGVSTLIGQLKILMVNPIGIIITAIVVAFTSLYAIFKDFSPLVDLISDKFAYLTGLFQGLQTAIGNFVQGAGFSTKAITDQADAAERASQMMRDYEESIDAVNLRQAQYEAQIDKLLKQAKNKAISDKEANEIIKEATRLQKLQIEELKNSQRLETAIQVEKVKAAGGTYEQILAIQKGASVASLNVQNETLEDELKALSQNYEKRVQAIGNLEVKSEKIQNVSDSLAEGRKQKQDKKEEEKKKKEEAENKDRAERAKEYDEKIKKQQENERARVRSLNEAEREQYAAHIADLKAIKDDDLLSAEERLAAIDELNKKGVLSDKEASDAKIKIAEEESNAKNQLLDAIANASATAADLVGKDTAEGKALAVASATISTYLAIAKTLAAFSGKAIPGYAIAQAIATGLAGFAAVKNILSVKVPNGGGGGGGSLPSMNMPTTRPSSGFTMLGNENPLRTTNEGGMIKVFVTESDITNSQNKVSSIQAKATIG